MNNNSSKQMLLQGDLKEKIPPLEQTPSEQQLTLTQQNDKLLQQLLTQQKEIKNFSQLFDLKNEINLFDKVKEANLQDDNLNKSLSQEIKDALFKQKNEYERIILNIRLSNNTVIENLATKYKSIIQDIMKSKVQQVQGFIDSECAKRTQSYLDVRQALFEKENKIKILQKENRDMEESLKNIESNYEKLLQDLREKFFKEKNNFEKKIIQLQDINQELLMQKEQIQKELEVKIMQLEEKNNLIRPQVKEMECNCGVDLLKEQIEIQKKQINSLKNQIFLANQKKTQNLKVILQHQQRYQTQQCEPKQNRIDPSAVRQTYIARINYLEEEIKKLIILIQELQTALSQQKSEKEQFFNELASLKSRIENYTLYPPNLNEFIIHPTQFQNSGSIMKTEVSPLISRPKFDMRWTKRISSNQYLKSRSLNSNNSFINQNENEKEKINSAKRILKINYTSPRGKSLSYSHTPQILKYHHDSRTLRSKLSMYKTKLQQMQEQQ